LNIKNEKQNKLRDYCKNFIKKDKMILLLTDTSIGSQSQKAQSIQKTFHFIRLCRAFFAIHFGKKIFWISLRSDDVMVKMLNTVKYRVAENVCNIVCFANISAQTK